MSRRVERQTDKAATKTIPCTYPDCDVDLIVNQFYAPAKGRCSEHRGKPTESIRLLARVDRGDDAPEAAPNGALANLLCPICRHPLKIIRCPGNFGYIDFGCAGKGCGTAVSIKLQWSPMLVKNVTPELAQLVEIFNKMQGEHEASMRDASMLGEASHL